MRLRWTSALASHESEVMKAVSHQQAPAGHGLAEIDRDGNHREVIFGEDYDLLGFQLTLLNSGLDYAPRGTLISWTAYLARQ
jgi:hypothetical protein